MAKISAPEALAGYHRSYDYIVAYPHSANIFLEYGLLDTRLSTMTRLSIDAAAAIWESQEEGQVVIPGETLFPGLDLADTGQLAIEHLAHSGFSDLDEHNPVLLPLLDGKQPLNNTYLQTRALAKFLDDKQTPDCGQPRVLIETLGYHLDRVIDAATSFGIEADFVAGENVLRAIGNDTYNHLIPTINSYFLPREFAIRALDFHRGWLFNQVVKHRGGRIVDIDADTYEITNTTANKRLAVVQGAQRILAGETI